MKKLFCFIGMTGAGKSTYQNEIINLIEKENLNVKPLVYTTTRTKREGEIEGKDYYFVDNKELFSLPQKDILEMRSYETIRGVKYYFTTMHSLENGDNFVGAVSIEQLANYVKHTNYIPNNKVENPIELYVIKLKCDLLTRFERVFKNRVKSEEDLLELCRRVLQERHDYKNEETLKYINYIPKENFIAVDNDGSITKPANIQVVLDFIKSKI